MILKFTLWGIALAIITVIFALLFWFYKKDQRRRVFIDSVKGLTGTRFSRLSIWKALEFISISTVIALLVILAARPQEVFAPEDSKKGLDIILTVDVSGSMSFNDVKPSRIEAAQSVIKDFVKNLKTDRVGLIAFTSVPVTLSPLTDDYEILNEYLDLFTPDKSLWLTGSGGTAVGDALLLSTQKFQKDVKRSRVIILITDGESNAGIEPLKAAQEAVNNNIRVYTIFIGDEYDGEAKATLQQISQSTNAKAYTVHDKDGLATIFDDIDKLERTSLPGLEASQYHDNPNNYFIALAAAWVIFLLLQLRKAYS